MTAPEYDPTTDPAQQFLHALPDHARRQLHHTARITVLVHRAVRDHSWTVEQLATECTRNWNGATNPGAIITHRLENIDGPYVARPEPFGRVLPFCTPECRDNAGWILDDDGLPVDRCPCRRSEVFA